MLVALFKGTQKAERKSGVKEEGDFRFDRWLRNMVRERDTDILELAVESGVSEKSIYEYMRGTRLPNLDNFQQILQALGKKIEIVDN